MSLRVSVFAWAVGLAACAARTPATETPVIIAGSICSDVRGLGPAALGEPKAAKVEAAPNLIAVVSEGPTSDAPQELSVVELDSQRTLWKKAVRAAARPQILQDVVVIVVTTADDKQVVAFDLATGAERFRRDLERPFWLGAAQSGKTVVLTTGAGSWEPRERGSSLIALDADSGSERWSRDVPYALTRPVIRGERVLVVADRADLWTLDLASGRDTGCGSIGGNTVEWIESDGASVFIGANEARVLDRGARPDERALELPRSDLPGRPFFRESSYLPQPANRSAHGRVGVIAPLATHEGAPVLGRGGFYFVFYRDVFAFRPDGSLSWAQLMEADVVRARAADAGLWVVTEAGELSLLAADSGEPRVRSALGVRVTSADVRTSSGAAPAASGPQLAAAAPAEPIAVDLQASLKKLAADTDARLLPARLLAVDELARLESSSASLDLLDVYSAPNTPRGLQDRIEKRMRERKLGAEVLVAALDEHEDFLEERKGAPLRAIVPGLVTQNEARALPGLIEHLFDPDTKLADLSMLVSAIDALGGERAREPLLRFFEMYRADSSLAAEPKALALAAEALIARDAGRLVLEATRDSTLTAPALREQLTALLTAPQEVPAPEVAKVAAAPAPAKPAPVALRTRLDEARASFEPCLTALSARAPKLGSVRLQFVAQPDGAVREVHVMPNDAELGQCLRAKLGELKLPSEQKELVSYRLVLAPAIAPALPSVERADSGAFWSRAEQRAPKAAVRSKEPPWWVDQNPLFLAIDVPPPPTKLLPSSPPPPSQPSPRAQAESKDRTPSPTAAPPQPQAAGPEDAWWEPVPAAKP